MKRNLITLFSSFVAALVLSACSATNSGPPKNVTSAYDGTYTGVAKTTQGSCDKAFDVTMKVTNGEISGTASSPGRTVDLSGYVTEDGSFSGSFASGTGSSIAKMQGNFTDNGNKVDGNWNLSLGADCSGPITATAESGEA